MATASISSLLRFKSQLVSSLRKLSKSFFLIPDGFTASFAELFYLRTQDKAEIDLIVDFKTHQHFIEIKKTATAKTKMLTALKKYKTEHSQAFLLYQGDTKPNKTNELQIMNYSDYLIKE